MVVVAGVQEKDVSSQYQDGQRVDKDVNVVEALDVVPFEHQETGHERMLQQELVLGRAAQMPQGLTFGEHFLSTH